MQIARLRYASLTLAIVLLLAHIFLNEPFSYRPLSNLRGKTFDAYQTLSPRPAAVSPLVIVAIDDTSLAQYGRWPWNRKTVADLVIALRDAGAAVIGLDVLFPEPDTGVNGAEGDAALAAALAVTPSLLAISLSDELADTKLVPKVGITPLGAVPENLPGFSGVISSLTILNEAAQGLGVIRSKPDGDGVLRELPMVWLQSTADGFRLWPSFALELVQLYSGAENYDAV